MVKGGEKKCICQICTCGFVNFILHLFYIYNVNLEFTCFCIIIAKFLLPYITIFPLCSPSYNSSKIYFVKFTIKNLEGTNVLIIRLHPVLTGHALSASTHENSFLVTLLEFRQSSLLPIEAILDPLKASPITSN